MDDVGYWEDALDVTATLLDVENIKVYRYEEAFSLSTFFRTFQRWRPVGDLLGRAEPVRLLYQWQL